jgi:hypothetical protein
MHVLPLKSGHGRKGWLATYTLAYRLIASWLKMLDKDERISLFVRSLSDKEKVFFNMYTQDHLF